MIIRKEVFCALILSSSPAAQVCCIYKSKKLLTSSPESQISSLPNLWILLLYSLRIPGHPSLLQQRTIWLLQFRLNQLGLWLKMRILVWLSFCLFILEQKHLFRILHVWLKDKLFTHCSIYFIFKVKEHF